MAYANTAITKKMRKYTISKNRVLALGLIKIPARSPTERPFSLTEITSALKSCTAPMNMVPRTTQTIAGTHPQKTAIAGPIIGAAPAIEAK